MGYLISSTIGKLAIALSLTIGLSCAGYLLIGLVVGGLTLATINA